MQIKLGRVFQGWRPKRHLHQVSISVPQRPPSSPTQRERIEDALSGGPGPPFRGGFARAPCRGFSLIEILVVVSIILILSLLLVPLLGRSSAALRLRCQSNLRELGSMLYQYSERHGRRLPDFSYSRWCGAIGVVPGGVYSWQVQPDGTMAWFIDERDDGIFHCPAQPPALWNSQGVRSRYAGLSVHSHRSLSDLDIPAKRVLLFEFEHDPAQVLESVGTPTLQIYAYDSFEPRSGPLQLARNHQTGGHILFADLHLELVEGPDLEIGRWEEAYQVGAILQDPP